MKQSWQGRHILVTGGTGFIGSFLVERLLDAGARVRVPLRAENYRALSSRRAEVEWIAGDLRDPAYCSELANGVDEVFHLAACRRNPEVHRKKSSDILNENVRMTLAIIEALKERGPVPVTFFSTANIPQSMDTVALSQMETVDGYVLGKALCETLWFTAARQHHFPLLIVRPVGAYGPRDTFTEEGNVIPAMMVKARDSDDALQLWGSGDEERAFLYVEDLVDAVLALREEDARDIQYITTSDVVTVRRLAEAVIDLVHPGLTLRFDSKKRLAKRAVPALPIHPVLQTKKWTPLAEGLLRTYAFWSLGGASPEQSRRARDDKQIESILSGKRKKKVVVSSSHP